jgi:endonuclease/exonuclease/phosphatase family metal-dependent hydrolase
VWLALVTSACASAGSVSLRKLASPPCEVARRAAIPLDWFGPDAADERVRLSAWCESVGPASVRAPARAVPLPDISRTGLIIVTWNVHEGGGDIQRLLADLRVPPSGGRDADPELVLLVQEAFRSGDDVPLQIPLTVRPPRPIHPKRSAIGDIVSAADQAGMWLAYVPSMRNGGNTREDRGSAILSTLPLSDVAAIELPWLSQRRVAVMATVSARQGDVPWRLRAISVHLDNRPGRSRQAAALAGLVSGYKDDETPIVIGGDLNTWSGPREDAVRRIDEVVARARECGNAPTFRFRRHLDYLFTTLPASVRRGCRIAADAFGSDHRPTILRLFGS